MGQADFGRTRDRTEGRRLDGVPVTEPPQTPAPLPLAEIEEAIRGVRHGTVQIIIQDGVVVQIDRTDKRRLR